MSRRARSEWPEPWARLRWAPGDVARIERLLGCQLTERDRTFVQDMQAASEATLQQVAWLRTLGRRYRVSSFGGDPVKASRDDGDSDSRYIDLDEET